MLWRLCAVIQGQPLAFLLLKTLKLFSFMALDNKLVRLYFVTFIAEFNNCEEGCSIPEAPYSQGGAVTVVQSLR
jgi:hypothetical protein